MSRGCDRVEREGLERLERGLPLDEHYGDCADCRDALAVYSRLRERVGGLGTGTEPAPEWQRQVWAAIEERLERRRWRRGWLPAAVVTAAAVAVVALLVRGPTTYGEPLLEIHSVRGDGTYRGETALPGDQLVLRADTGGRPYAELRVYRNFRELVLRCPGGPSCRRHGDVIEAEMTLDRRATYSPLLIAATSPVPAPSGGFDGDVAAALKTEAVVRVTKEVAVH